VHGQTVILHIFARPSWLAANLLVQCYGLPVHDRHLLTRSRRTKMTVTYSAEVATASFGSFIRLLFR